MDIMEKNDLLTDDDELLVRSFFEDNRTDIADNGFTERVMRRLPPLSVRLNRIWTAACAVIGAVWLFDMLPDITMKNVKGCFYYFGRNIVEGLWNYVVSFEISQRSLLMICVAFLILSVMFVYNLFDRQMN